MKYILISIFVSLILFELAGYAFSGPHIISKIDEMEINIENQFDCSIRSSQCVQFLGYQYLRFDLEPTSPRRPSEEEIRLFLTEHFNYFSLVDQFEFE